MFFLVTLSAQQLKKNFAEHTMSRSVNLSQRRFVTMKMVLIKKFLITKTLKTMIAET